MLTQILDEIRKEREYQDQKWGHDFDDQNEPKDWAAFILKYLSLGITTRMGGSEPSRPFRESMLKVAALAVAAIESHDRGVD